MQTKHIEKTGGFFIGGGGCDYEGLPVFSKIWQQFLCHTFCIILPHFQRKLHPCFVSYTLCHTLFYSDFFCHTSCWYQRAYQKQLQNSHSIIRASFSFSSQSVSFQVMQERKSQKYEGHSEENLNALIRKLDYPRKQKAIVQIFLANGIPITRHYSCSNKLTPISFYPFLPMVNQKLVDKPSVQQELNEDLFYYV